MCTTIWINKSSFSINFDKCKIWTVTWKWSNNWKPKNLENKVTESTLCPHKLGRNMNARFTCSQKNMNTTPKGFTPLMVIVQGDKMKAYSVMDYRALKDILTYLWQIQTSMQKKIREWQHQGKNICIIDLRKSVSRSYCCHFRHLYLRESCIALQD